ncbi:hypothetical protein Pcinc_020897 [Petrolisthes cinctipes]|uniref:Ionotropic glutamate receptor C-terminal domain-containing protein n=1 Tax=Petrolisthes cinctipes TaxID=88211 RepID=A0AAE1FH79_PETCI|nr:hypothetical protein Pcinc_020897 [Petrolisthes cinctipes]
MEPKRLLWLLIFVYSARWLVPAQIQHQSAKDIKNIKVRSLIPSFAVDNYNEKKLYSDKTQDFLNKESTSLKKKNMTLTEAGSLSELLATVVKQELSGCGLVLVYDSNDLYSVVVQDLLLLLPNARQVIEVRSTEDLLKVEWVSTGCGGYLLLLDHPQPLLTFANTHHHTWDYHGRYVFVSQRVEQVEALVATRNGKKTEHILGVVKGGQEGEWRVYMNMLYWGEGVRPVTTWRHHRFTSQSQLFPDKLDDLQGAILKVSTFELAPSIMYYRTDNGSLLYRYGEDVFITETLSSVLNFRLHYAEPADDDVFHGKDRPFAAPLAVSGLSVPSVDLVGHLRRSHPVRSNPVLVGHRRWSRLLRQLIRATKMSCHNKTVFVDYSERDRLGSSWQYTFGMHFREPQTIEPRINTTRIFVMFLWLYTMVLTLEYSSNLTAFLLVQKAPASLQTIREVHDSGLEVAALGYIFNFSLASSVDPYLRGLTKVYRAYPSEDELFSRALDGQTFVLQNRGYLEFHATTYVTRQGIPRLRILKECFAPYSIAMVLQKYSPLKRKFDLVIGWLQQSGLVDHYFRQSLRQAAAIEEEGGGGISGGGGGDNGEEVVEDEALEALNLDHMQGVFMVAAIGWFIAIHTFIVEAYVWRH